MGQSRWAVVTGSSSGIGRATALRLADAGWNVVVHARRSRDEADAVATAIRSRGQQSHVELVDFSNPAACVDLVERLWDRLGGIDAWLQFAGADLLTGPGAKLPMEEKLALALTVDLHASILTCRQIGKKMKEQGRGAIVTMGWDQAGTGMEGDSGEIFAAVKGGVMAFTRSLAKSLAPVVRVNCVAPGWILTAWGSQASPAWQERVVRETPLRRWGTPEEIAEVSAFLVSDQAQFVTGQCWHVNGGAVTT